MRVKQEEKLGSALQAKRNLQQVDTRAQQSAAYTDFQNGKKIF